MGRVASYKRPKAANDPRRYEEMLFGESNLAPNTSRGSQKMTVSERRQRQRMARWQGKPDPFAAKEPAQVKVVPTKKSSKRKSDDGASGPDASTSSKRMAVEEISNTSEAPDVDATGTPSAVISTTTNVVEPKKPTHSEAPMAITNSDKDLNARVMAAVKRRKGESLKQYKNRLRRERNHVLKATIKQSQNRTAKSKNYFATKKAKETQQRAERKEEAEVALASKLLPVVPFGSVNERPPSIDAFKERMKKRLLKMTTVNASAQKYTGLSDVERYKSQVQDAYRNLKLKQAHLKKTKPRRRKK